MNGADFPVLASPAETLMEYFARIEAEAARAAQFPALATLADSMVSNLVILKTMLMRDEPDPVAVVFNTFLLAQDVSELRSIKAWGGELVAAKQAAKRAARRKQRRDSKGTRG